jgi:hypothetical protein
LLDPDAQSDTIDISLISAIAHALETIVNWYFAYLCILIGHRVKVTLSNEDGHANTHQR